MQNVAVFFGGDSYENEISVLTGILICNVLSRTKFMPIPVYLHTDGGMYTAKTMLDVHAFQPTDVRNFTRVFLDGGVVYGFYNSKKKVKPFARLDVAINCCHGGLGEGGGVAALAALNGVPFASPPLTPSGIFLDKCMTKTVLKALNIPSLEYIRVNEQDYKKRGTFLLKTVERRLRYPVVIKPAHLGSSIGIRVARNEDELKEGLESAFVLDYRVLLERYLEKKADVNCAAYARNGEIFVSEPEVAFGAGVYSFEEKYLKENPSLAGKNTTLRKRCFLEGELRDKIRAYTRTVYKRMNLKGVVRMDFLVAEQEAYLSEVNTVPGSLAYYLFCERLGDARAFLTGLLEEAIQTHTSEKKSVLPTGVLQKIHLRK